jgi:hypothetical protein
LWFFLPSVVDSLIALKKVEETGEASVEFFTSRVGYQWFFGHSETTNYQRTLSAKADRECSA